MQKKRERADEGSEVSDDDCEPAPYIKLQVDEDYMFSLRDKKGNVIPSTTLDRYAARATKHTSRQTPRTDKY